MTSKQSVMKMLQLFTVISLCILAFANTGVCESSIGVRLGVFDSADARVKDYYGVGPVGSIYYEWLHTSGLGCQAKASMSYSSKTYAGEEQTLVRIPLGLLAVYKPPAFKAPIKPYLGAGYTWVYTNEQGSAEILEPTEGGSSASSIGYEVMFGLEYRISKHYSISWQSDLSIVKVVSGLSMQNIDYGGVSSTIGFAYHF